MAGLFAVTFVNLSCHLDMPVHNAMVKWSATRICSYACGSNSDGSNDTVSGKGNEGDAVGSSSRNGGIGSSDDKNTTSTMNTRRSSSDSYTTKVYPTVSTSPEGLLFAVDFHSFLVSIYMNQQQHQPALIFSSHRFHAAADIHLPTKKMIARCNGTTLSNGDPMTGDHLTVQIQEILQFLHQYQAAEDDAKELKLAQGLGSEGKMKSMLVEFPSLVVSIHDRRLASVRVCVVSNCMAGLRTFQFRGQDKASGMGGDWVQGGIAMFDDLCDPSDDGINKSFSGGDQDNVNKEMMVDVGNVKFLSEDVSSKVMHNNNNSSSSSNNNSNSRSNSSTPTDHAASSSATLSSSSPSSSISYVLPPQTSTESSSGGGGGGSGSSRDNNSRGSGGGHSGSSNAEVMIIEGIKMTINKHVNNNDDFVDDEEMEGHIRRVCMEQLTPQVQLYSYASLCIPDIHPYNLYIPNIPP